MSSLGRRKSARVATVSHQDKVKWADLMEKVGGALLLQSLGQGGVGWWARVATVSHQDKVKWADLIMD